MKAPNITPGEWHVPPHSPCYVCTKELPCRHIAECENPEDDEENQCPIEQVEANARLIAAAPQIAKALNDLTVAFETLWRITCKDLPNDTLEAAKSALLAAGYTE